jgi:hypothetical protein
MTNSFPDPLEMWRKAISTLEGSGNSLANKAMESGEFAGALHQVATLSLGMQQAFEKAIGVYLKQLNLPSRKDITELAATLERVEAKLDELISAGTRESGEPRPPRTRRPDEHADGPAAAKEV